MMKRALAFPVMPPEKVLFPPKVITLALDGFSHSGAATALIQ